MRTHKLPLVLTLTILPLIISTPSKAADLRTDRYEQKAVLLIGGQDPNAIRVNLGEKVQTRSSGQRVVETNQGRLLDFSVYIDLTFPTSSLSSWIHESVTKGVASTRLVELTSYDPALGKMRQDVFPSNYVISRVIFPMLNAKSSSQAEMSVQIIPSGLPLGSGGGGGSTGRVEHKTQTLISERDFSVENNIGLPEDVQVQAVSHLTWQKEGGQVQISPVQLTLLLTKDVAKAFSDLMTKVRIGGLLRGSITLHLMNPMTRLPMYSIELHNLTLVSFQQSQLMDRSGLLSGEMVIKPAQVIFTSR